MRRHDLLISATPLEADSTFERYEALSDDERERAARLIAHTGCSVALAVAAIEALRTEPQDGNNGDKQQ